MTDLNQNRPGLRRRDALALLPVALALPWPVVAQTELTDLARIRASGALKVAVYKDNAPFSSSPAADMKGLLAAAIRDPDATSSESSRDISRVSPGSSSSNSSMHTREAPLRSCTVGA